MTELFRTDPAQARCVGWARLRPGGVWHSLLPLIDVSTGLLASLGEHTEPTLQAMGARLPTYAEVDELNNLGHLLSLTLLPTPEMRARLPQMPGESNTAYGVRLYAPMGSIEWSQVARDLIVEKLHATNWDGQTPVVNAGKYPCRNGPDLPPKGRMYLRGYDPDGPGPKAAIQQGATGGPGPHAWTQRDYGTVAKGCADGDEPPTPFDAVALGVFMGLIEPTGANITGAT